MEDLTKKNKALQAQVDELNKAHTLALSDLSKLSEEHKNLEATLSNQEESMQALTSSLSSTKEEVQKKEEEIVALWDAYLEKFTKGVNHMKTIIFQDIKDCKHLSWNVDQFLAEQEEAWELADESENSEATTWDV